MSRLPIRARLTVAFAAAMVVVLVGTVAVVYLQMRAGLTENVDANLRARAQLGVTPIIDDPEERFTQLLDSNGGVVRATGGTRATALTPGEIERSTRGDLLIERVLPGTEGTARVLAQPATGRDAGRIIVVGQTLNDREETLSSLLTASAVGGLLAVVVASGLGYLLAAVGLRPVEAMRLRAAQVSIERDDDPLPLPQADDEIRRLGETLNEMLDRLRRSFDRERRFVADASHELRTPVAVVKAELEGALRTDDYGPRVRESLVAAVEECDHLAQLAEDLLVIARSGDGGLPVRREQLGVRRLLDDVRRRFGDRAELRGRGIRIDAGEELEVNADPVRMRQALGNLLDNALRHGDGEVLITARHANNGVSFEVSDEGPGFAAEIATNAFARFSRGDAARTGEGTGLGLAIVRAIAEAHAGSAELATDRRATVRIWIPDASN